MWWCQNKFDRNINHRAYQVLDDFEFKSIKAEEIRVSDIVLVTSNEVVPADMLILAVDGASCEFFVDMSDVFHSLDMVKKKSLKHTQFSVINNGISLRDLRNSIENIKVKPPNKLSYEFSGILKLKGSPKAIDVNIDNLIIGGSVFRDCGWVLGIVVYTGMESKL